MISDSYALVGFHSCIVLRSIQVGTGKKKRMQLLVTADCVRVVDEQTKVRPVCFFKKLFFFSNKQILIGLM